MSSAAAAANRSLGIDRGLPFPLAWIGEAETLLVAGGNPLTTMLPLERYFTQQRERGGKAIVIDPRVTRFAEHATLHLQPAPGTDAALAYALLHVLIAERHLDTAYIDARTRGFADVRRSAEHHHPERAERRTGVAADDIRTAARMLAAQPRTILLTGRGVEQHGNGTDSATAFINLALALGLVGRPGSGYVTITGQGNGQGGREHGQKSDQLPGYGSVDDRAAVERVARVWNVTPERVARRGLTAAELLSSIGDRIHALFVMGSNPAVCAPDGDALREKLGRIEHLVVCDFFFSETAAQAHVGLPVLQWAEETGTTTNLEGRVLLRERYLDAPPGPRSDLFILRELARRLGAPALLPSEEPCASCSSLLRSWRSELRSRRRWRSVRSSFLLPSAVWAPATAPSSKSFRSASARRSASLPALSVRPAASAVSICLISWAPCAQPRARSPAGSSRSPRSRCSVRFSSRCAGASGREPS